MKKIKFTDSSERGNEQSEILEFEDNASDQDIQKEYEIWVWERIGDNFNWEEV